MATGLMGFFSFASTCTQSLAWWQVQVPASQGRPPTQQAVPTAQVRARLSASDYRQTLYHLLPSGPAWTDEPDTAISRLFDGLSQELARIDARCWALIEEADPRTALDLFTDWQQEFALPDACVQALGGSQTQAQLRLALLGRVVSVGGSTAAYFESVAQALGFSIRITEFLGSATPYRWQVEVALGQSLTSFRFSSTFADPWASWGSVLLECVLKRLAPAHTELVFSYTG